MPEISKEQMLIVIGVILALIAGCVYSNLSKKAIITQSSPPVTQGAADGYSMTKNDQKNQIDKPKSKIFVQIAGAVDHEGLYKLEQGDRMVDLVRLAGLREDADSSGLNLAEPVSDGEKVVIPQKTLSKPPSDSGDLPQERSPAEKININTADQKELDSLPGVGPVMAKKIVDYRAEHGRFMIPDDIKNVPGISEKKFQAMSKSITTY